MFLGRRILFAILTVSLATFALDCAGMTTPEQAMQCCNSMHCPSHGHHGQDCCKTMPNIHSAIGQPTSVHSVSYSRLVHGPVQAFPGRRGIASTAGFIADHSPDPPPRPSPPISPLRI